MLRQSARSICELAASAIRFPHAKWNLSTVAAAVAKPAAEAAAKPGLGAVVLFVPSAVCGYLAYWQYERSKWKDDLINLRKAELYSEPSDIYSVAETLHDYQKVSVSGTFRNEDSLYVGPRPRSIPGMGIQSGYLLFTPLYNDKRTSAVMINRGWVPSSWLNNTAALPDGPQVAPPAPEPAATTGRKAKVAAKAAAPLPPVAPRVTVVGMVMPSETPSAAVPDNKPDRNEFHWVDSAALAEACGLPHDTPLVQIISEDPSTVQTKSHQSPLEAKRSAPQDGYAPPSFPIPKNAGDLLKFATMPTDHIIYAVTWVSLFVVLGGMAASAAFRPSRGIRIVNVNNKDLWGSVNPGAEKV